MKKTILIMTVAVLATVFIHGSAFSQKKTIERTISSKAVQASRGENPNIKSDVPTEDKKVTKSRGAYNCEVYFDNYSGLYVKVYVNGYYMGTMSPYGSLTVYVDDYADIYCVSAGGTREWADHGTCDGYYHFKLE